MHVNPSLRVVTLIKIFRLKLTQLLIPKQMILPCFAKLVMSFKPFTL